MGRILLVPSDRETSERWGAAMRAAGHTVLFALTLREAERRIANGGIGVIVVDSLDPRVGLEQLARITIELGVPPPIVLASASPLAPMISARIGAAAFLPKPCEPKELIAVVERLLRFDESTIEGEARRRPSS